MTHVVPDIDSVRACCTRRQHLDGVGSIDPKTSSVRHLHADVDVDVRLARPHVDATHDRIVDEIDDAM